MKKGNSYRFLGTPYTRNNPKENKLQPGDLVIIHPVPGVSQATKSYPGIIDESPVKWVSGEAMELGVKGRGSNVLWHGAVMNEYLFSRLEFVKKPSNLDQVIESGYKSLTSETKLTLE